MFFRKVEDVTTISKSQSLTLVSIKDCTLRVPNNNTTLFLHEQLQKQSSLHVRHVYMHTRKHSWNDGVASTAREARLEARKLHPSPCPRSSSHHHDSMPPRLHPLICTGAGPIHQILSRSCRGPRPGHDFVFLDMISYF